VRTQAIIPLVSAVANWKNRTPRWIFPSRASVVSNTPSRIIVATAKACCCQSTTPAHGQNVKTKAPRKPERSQNSSEPQAATLVGLTSRSLLELVIGIARGFIMIDRAPQKSMAPMPPSGPPGIAGLCLFGSSATIASVVISRPAMEAASLQRGRHDFGPGPALPASDPLDLSDEPN